MESFAPHLDWIDSQEQHMIHLTEQWSRINSGSFHVEGVNRMGEVIADHFSWLKPSIEHIDVAPLTTVNSRGEEDTVPLGRALRIRKRPDAPLQVLLSGHLDTVFGKDHHFQEPVYNDDVTIMNGPGVADLKGGLVCMLKALEALERSPWAEQIGWEVVMPPDEEIGSQSSDFLFKEAAERCRFGMIYEPALRDGTLAGARKGSGNFSVVVRGRAAHAGREHHLGRNAIVACAEITQAIDALNGQRDGVTINPGKVEGGGPLNMVPDLAIMRFNTRMESVDDQQWLQAEFERVLDGFAARDGISVALHGGFTRAPKPMSDENAEIFDLVKTSGAQLGLEIGWKATGGCCDGNNFYKYGLPNVDTLGVRGGDIHSDKEFVMLDSLVERARLSALILMRVASGDVKLKG